MAVRSRRSQFPVGVFVSFRRVWYGPPLTALTCSATPTRRDSQGHDVGGDGQRLWFAPGRAQRGARRARHREFLVR